jgi:hypothetical protein
MALLHTAADRDARVSEKRARLLSFLRDEVYSSAEVLSLVMGLESRQATHKSLVKFAQEALIVSHEVQYFGRRFLIWGITAHGQAMAFNLSSEKNRTAVFEPSRMSLQNLGHTLDVQRIRLRAEAAGWTAWRNGESLGKLPKDANRPDALAISAAGIVIAVEVERTIKTRKRYEVILVNYLRAIKAEKIQLVVWVCPTRDFAARLRAIITGITHVRTEGKKVAIEPARHHSHIRFLAYDQWPTV